MVGFPDGPSFMSLQKWTNEIGTVYAEVENDRLADNFRHLVGQSVRVDNHWYHCVGVQRDMHEPPWRPGEIIRLTLAPHL